MKKFVNLLLVTYRFYVVSAFKAFYFGFIALFSNLRSSEFEHSFLDVIVPVNSSGQTFIIDVGSNIGRYSIPLARLISSSGIIYSFEPNFFSFQIQLFILHCLNLQNICIVNASISDSNCVGFLSRSFSRPSSAVFTTETASKSLPCTPPPLLPSIHYLQCLA